MENVNRLYESASEAEKEEGARWYLETHLAAVAMANRFQLTVQQTAGVVAAISPSNRWATNLRQATQYCKAAVNREPMPKASTYGIQQRKAWAIANLPQSERHDSERVYHMLGKRAYKTKAFYSNILDPFTSQQVALDLWMARVLGRETERFNKGEYDQLSDMFRYTAEQLDLMPHQVQATVWVYARNNS